MHRGEARFEQLNPLATMAALSGGIVLLSVLSSAAQTLAMNVTLNSLFGVRPRRMNLSNKETRIDVECQVYQPDYEKPPFSGG